ncbi:hypothetical protein EXIGLDRAFT_787527 [Exidia glandulosa HHB12029]|uniref:Uncharacterized protein n=1 Tax=Exidia glandulosa HHB12029 TaxID=1314781 RepID=A0A166MTC4_EXIGL|nr:hypothetical protein EXIGLDRAFT_787527 [Exidia glandulosa HHB12029]
MSTVALAATDRGGTADTTSRAAPALSGALTTLRVTQQAVQGVPIAREIIGAAAQILEFAERIDKNNEKLRTLADRASVLARDVQEVVTTRGGVEPEGAIAQRLEVLTKSFEKVKNFMSQEINAPKSARRLLRRLFVHPTTVELLSQDLETAVQSFLLAAALDTRLYVEARSPHDGQLLDCHVRKLDAIMTQETEHGTIVYAKARVDGVHELMVVKYHTNSSASARPDSGSDMLASISSLTTSHPNIAQLYGRSARTAATQFTVLRSGMTDYIAYVFGSHLSSGVHCAVDYFTCGYADEAQRYSFTLLWYRPAAVSASAHLEEMGLIWYPESRDALVVDDYGQPTVGTFDDLASLDRSPRHEGVLALLSTFNAVRRLMIPGPEHFTELSQVDRCDRGTLKACVEAAIRSRASKLEAIWNVLLSNELSIEVWKEILPTVDLGNISAARSWSKYTRLHGVGMVQEGSTEMQATIECVYIRKLVWRGGREVSNGLQLSLLYGTETFVHKDFLVNLSDDLAARVLSILGDAPTECAEVTCSDLSGALATNLNDHAQLSYDLLDQNFDFSEFKLSESEPPISPRTGSIASISVIALQYYKAVGVADKAHFGSNFAAHQKFHCRRVTISECGTSQSVSTLIVLRRPQQPPTNRKDINPAHRQARCAECLARRAASFDLNCFRTLVIV